MNKIYKLIWSKTKNCWVVASELAKGHGKNKSRREGKSLLAVAVMTALLGGAFLPAGMVSAADGAAHYVNVAVNTGKTIEARKYPGEAIEESAIDPDANYDLSANPTINAISIGAEASAWNNGAVAMGFKTIAKGEYATALGTGSAAYSKGDLALGWKAYTGWNEPNKIAIGTESTALKENGISIGTKSKTWYDNAIAIGNEAETGNKGGVTSNDSIAIGNKAKIQGQKNVAIGSEVTVGTGSTSSGSSYVVAIGSESHAYDTDSVVIGGHSEVHENAVVVGNRSKAGMQSVAVGSSIEAGEWSVAIGLESKAKNHAIAMGYSSEASAVDSVAFGNNASAKGLGAIAIGGNYDRPNQGAQAYSGDTIAIGRGSVAGNEEDTAAVYNSVAVGREARAYGKNSIALGGTANVGDIWQKQLADGGTAIGSSANAALENATAIGYKSIAYAKDAVTLGANTRADIDGGVALGSDSNVGSYSSSSYGKAGKVGYDPLDAGTDETSTWKSTRAAVSVGNQQKGITRQIINVAAGTDNTDAVNVAQLKSLRQRAWKDLAEAKDQLGARIATNTTSITALSGKVRTNTQDIGRLKTDVQTNDTRIRYLYDNMPFMHYVSVNEKNTNKTTDNRKNDGAKKVGSIAIGVNTAAYGEDAVALGGNSFVRGQGSVIVGESSDNYTGGLAAKEGQFDQSVILGSNNTIFAQAAKNGGREDKIIGNMNRVEESHGTFVRGTGNMVYDAYNDEALTDEDKQKEQDFLDPIDGGDPTGLFQKGRSHVTVEGDGNLVGGALYTQVSGVGNEVSNSQPDENSPSTPRVTYNIVTGNRNTVVDSSHNLMLGDNHELENVNGNIIIGSQKTKTKTEKSNVTILGNDANVSVEGGVALGTGSVASTAAEVAGYDPATGEASAKATSTWKSGNGAVSVGTADKTRQITNLAAGTENTDAVNVAQLKNSKTTVEAGDYVTVTKKAEDGKGTTYTVKGPTLSIDGGNLTVNADEKDGKKVGYKLSLNKELTGLTSVSSEAFKVGDKTYINSQGINANSNKITNVAAGAADGDAVNFKQLSDVKTKVEANEGNITTNKNAIADLTPKVTTNTANIGKLQAGFTVKDGGAGKADVTLGGDKKQEVTFKAAVDKTTQATADTKSLSSSVDADRNVTYTLNMSQLKKDLGITEGTDGVMSSWKLKATGGDTTEQDIKNGEAVTFDVAAADKGLTVTRDGKTIKYGIEGSKIDIANNQSITNLGKRIDNLDPIHYFSVNSTDKDAGSNYKNDGATGSQAIAIGAKAKSGGNSSVALGTQSEATYNGGVAVGWESKSEGRSSIAIGSESKSTSKDWGGVAIGASAESNGSFSLALGGMSKAIGGWNIAIGTEASTKADYFGTAIGYKASVTQKQALAFGTMANAGGDSAISIGTVAKSFANNGLAIGTLSTVNATGGRGIAIGNAAYVGPAKPSDTTAMPKPSDEWKPGNPYVSQDDNTQPGANEGAQEKAMAVGFKASAFGYQTTALGAGAQAHDSNTTAVGTAAVAKGHHSTALGMQARTFEKESTSVGHWADSRAEFATSVGANTIVYKKGGVALGFGARAYDENSVAIGSNSFAKEAVDGKAYLSDEAIKASAGIVSVGSPNYKVGDTDVAANYRRIVNVAGGIHDNDAVNVLQLKALEGKVTTNADNITKGWVLKATSDTGEEEKGKTINNTDNEVTFDASGNGLTVKRDGKTIKYGIDGSKIDLDGNTSITNLSNEIEKSKIHYFSVKSDDSANPDGTNWKNDGATGKNAIAIGKDAKAERESSVVVGLNASSGDAANDGVAVGSRASVTGFGGVAIGRESSAEGQETVAIGTGAKGAIHRTVAIGGYANADGFGAVAIGRDSSSKEMGVALGNSSFSHAYSVGVGEKAIAEAPYSVAVGDLTGSYAMGAVTLGNKTRAFGDSSVAIGNQARVSGKGITPEEYKALSEADQKLYRLYEAVYHNYDDPSKPIVDRKYYKVIDAHDWRAENHYNSIAIGTTSFVEAKEAIGIGAGTRINGDRGVALGYAAVSEEKGTALGAGAQAKANAGVALGEGAVADTAAEVAGYDPKTGKASTETTSTWKSVKGAVSVGTADATRQITNLAAGSADTDAVNVAQLKALEGKVTGNEGDITTLKEGWTLEDAAGSKKVVKATNTVKVTGDDYITATVGSDGLTLGMNETKLNTQINNQIDNSETVKAKMNSWVLKATSDKDAEKAGKTIDNKDNAVTFDATGNGLTVTRDGSTIKYGIDGSKIDITGNKSITDLQTEIKESKTTVEAAANSQITVTPEKQNDKSTKYVVDIAKDGTIDGDKDGNLVTGETVKKYVDANKVTVTGDEEGSGVKVENVAKTGEPANYKVSLGDKVKVGNVVIDDKDGKGSIFGLSEVTVGENVTLDKTGLTIKEGPSVTTKGIDAGKKKITNVKDGDVSATSTDAVNGKQLFELKQTVEQNKVTVEAAANSQITVTAEPQNDKSTKYVVDIAKDGTIGGAKDGNLVTGKTVKDYVDANKVTVTGDEEGSGVKVENTAAAGQPANYKVSLGDKVKAGDVTVDGTKGAGQITGLSNTKWDADKIVSGRAATEDQLKAVSENAAEAAKKHTTVVAGDYVTVSEGTNANGGKEYTVTGPKVSVAKDEKNLVVGDIMDGNKKVGYELKLNKELTGLTSVSSTTFKAGDNVTINNEGLTIKEGPSVTTKGIDAGKKKITNVAAGDVSEKSTEAVNGGQLFGVEQKVNINSRNISILGGKVSELNTRVNRVGAGAAALAALHPLDFDPDDKWDFAAGYGNYKGANAAAIGAYYRPNEDTMVSVGGSFGGGENMVNAGVSVKLGQGNHVTTSRVAMAKEIKDLRAEVEVLRQAVTGIGQGQTPDPVKMKLFPDIAKNHWAYEAVEELTKQGLLEGYPDGTFGGDRMMTRYEFATLVYRAMQKGLNVNEKLIQEFEPELERFRIDVISKDKNGNPVIERVRVNEKKKAK